MDTKNTAYPFIFSIYLFKVCFVDVKEYSCKSFLYVYFFYDFRLSIKQNFVLLNFFSLRDCKGKIERGYRMKPKNRKKYSS